MTQDSLLQEKPEQEKDSNAFSVVTIFQAALAATPGQSDECTSSRFAWSIENADRYSLDKREDLSASSTCFLLCYAAHADTNLVSVKLMHQLACRAALCVNLGYVLFLQNIIMIAHIVTGTIT
jgi:hypothetical protein